MASFGRERRIIPHDELKREPRTKPEPSRARPEELRLLEALLFAAAEPLDEKTLGARLPEDVDVQGERCARCRPNTRRAASTSCASASKWTFRTAGDLSWLLTKEAVVPQQAVARGDRDARRSSPTTSR